MPHTHPPLARPPSPWYNSHRKEPIYLIPVQELTDFDYEILEKVAVASAIEERELVECFPEQTAITLRIELLRKKDRHEGFHGIRPPIPNTSYLDIIAGKLKITPRGLKALEEWQLRKKKHLQKLREDRISKFAPIVISTIALIVAIISLLQSLHWIDLEK